MRQKLIWLADVARMFSTYMSSCPVDVFLKLSIVQDELVVIERKMDNLVELIKTEEIRYGDCIKDVNRVATQLDHLTDIHVILTKECMRDQINGFSRAADLNADRFLVNMAIIRQLLLPPTSNEDAPRLDMEDRAKLMVEIIGPMDEFSKLVKTIKIVTRKLSRRMTELYEKHLMPKDFIYGQFKTAHTTIAKMSNYCDELLTRIAGHYQDCKELKRFLSLPVLQQILYATADEILRQTDISPLDNAMKLVQGYIQELNRFSELIDEDKNLETVTPVVTPWACRAQEFKSEIMLTVDVDRRVQSLNDQILGLTKEFKFKERVLKESHVKIELLESRMEKMKKQGETIIELEKELEQSKIQEKNYEEALENLQADLEALEKENTRLKRSPVKPESALTSPTTDTDPRNVLSPTTASPETIEIASSSTIYQVDSLRSIVRYLRTENSELKRRAMFRDADNLLPVTTTAKTATVQLPKDADQILKSIALEAKVLIKDMRAVSATPKLIDLTTLSTSPSGIANLHTKKWQSRKQSPQVLFQQQQSLIYTLQQRGDALKEKLRTVVTAPTRQPARMVML
ncbi:dynein associated protein-domain-containing protein [Syncephalis fuscata]|nr:dynein associated protein-domain-containing protein [Syncephalis fuscata]